VLDKSNRSEKYSAAEFTARAGIPTTIDARHAIAHNKIMILDRDTVITGSFNFTWEIEGDRLHVTTRREDLSIPFEATARTLTLRRPEGTITYARVE